MIDRPPRKAVRAQRDAALRELVPGDSMGARFDRTAWAIMGQPVPATGFSWARAIPVLVMVAVLALGFRALVDETSTLPVIMGAIYSLYLFRARRAWDHYAERRRRESAQPPGAQLP